MGYIDLPDRPELLRPGKPILVGRDRDVGQWRTPRSMDENVSPNAETEGRMGRDENVLRAVKSVHPTKRTKKWDASGSSIPYAFSANLGTD